MIRVTFLGTGASRPTVGRNVSAIAMNRAGEHLLFDCGEGTQRQMMRYGTGFTVSDIFFTHMHADHFLGVIGLLRTMGLQGRTAPMRLWAPAGGGEILDVAVNLGVERVPYEIGIRELRPDVSLPRDDYDILPFRTRHGRNSLGYALVEHDRLGRFDPERARALGVSEGPAFGRLHRGEPVEVGARTVRPDDVVGPPRRGRRIVYTGDTRPTPRTVDAARGADLLIHDGTFGDDEAARARATDHSTAREAAKVAKRAGVRRLALTHVSSRYGENSRPLRRQARDEFCGAIVAYDGLEIEVPYPPDED